MLNSLRATLRVNFLAGCRLNLKFASVRLSVRWVHSREYFPTRSDLARFSACSEILAFGHQIGAKLENSHSILPPIYAFEFPVHENSITIRDYFQSIPICGVIGETARRADDRGMEIRLPTTQQ